MGKAPTETWHGVSPGGVYPLYFPGQKGSTTPSTEVETPVYPAGVESGSVDLWSIGVEVEGSPST
jgi:hypothetical protein